MESNRSYTLTEYFIITKNNHDDYNLIKKWYSTRDWISKLESLKTQKKNDEIAEHIKEHGNEAYAIKDFNLAMNLYIKAILFANKNGSIYGTILANISGCLYELQLFKKCVMYIDACLSTSYPNTSRPKLYVRKIKAFSSSGEKKCAAEASLEFKKFMKRCKMSSADKEKYLKLAEEAMKITEVFEADFMGDYLLPEFEENPKILNVTRSATLKYDKDNGRHIVAQVPIKKGECVLIEKPYASVGCSRCPNCFKYIKNITTCEQCPGIMYCSNMCREQDAVVHRWECKFYRIEAFRDLDENIRLAFRVFLQGLHGGYKFNTNKIEEDLQFGDKIDNFPYVRQMYGKFSEIDVDKRVSYLDGCCILLACINVDKKLKDWIASKIGSNLYLSGKFLLQLMANCNINARYTEDNDGLICNQLYPSRSLFNHSCVPNGILRFQEDKMVMMTLKDIQPGEQIYVSYIRTIIDYLTPEARKKVLLEAFSFTCNCTLCTTNSVMQGLLPCPKCKFYSDIDDNGRLDCTNCRTKTTPSHGEISKMKIFRDAEKLFKFNARPIPSASAIKNMYKNLKDVNFSLESENDICNDINILRGGIEVAAEININPHCYVMVGIYMKYIYECIKLGKLDESANYLQYIEDIESNICVSSNVQVFAELKMVVKKMCSLNGWSIPKYKKSTLIEYERHLEFMHEFVYVYFPSESVLKDLKKIQEFFSMQKQIIELRESLDWIN